jgi:DNA-binding CsgD family transcriptional regulator
MTKPLLIVGGTAARAEAADDLVLRGWRLSDGWSVEEPAQGLVCCGPVTEAADVARVMLAVISGAGVLAQTATRPLAEQLGDDLRRVGPVQHRFPDLGWVVLDPEERRLLDLLDAGASLGEAARLLHIARRTADRRLAAARARLGAPSNAATMVVRRRRLSSIPAALSG